MNTLFVIDQPQGEPEFELALTQVAAVRTKLASSVANAMVQDSQIRALQLAARTS